MINPLSPQLAQTLRRRAATVTGAVLIGLVALSFASLADAAQKAFGAIASGYSWTMLAATPLGFALLVYLTRRFAPEARGSGVPQVIAAAPLPEPERSPLLSLKTAVAKYVLTLAALLVGASAGREGPTVQISAALMTAVHRAFRVPLSAAVVIAGGAAGVSAAFNTPLAGVTFAFEELASAYEQRLTLLVMAAVVISGLVSLGVAGDYLYFGSLQDALAIGPGLIAVPVIAVVGGVAGGLFARIVLFMSHARLRLPVPIRDHPVLFAAACGLVVAILHRRRRRQLGDRLCTGEGADRRRLAAALVRAGQVPRNTRDLGERGSRRSLRTFAVGGGGPGRTDCAAVSRRVAGNDRAPGHDRLLRRRGARSAHLNGDHHGDDQFTLDAGCAAGLRADRRRCGPLGVPRETLSRAFERLSRRGRRQLVTSFPASASAMSLRVSGTP